MPKYSKNGIPDIIVIKDGFFVGLEVKAPKGKQSESQKEFEKGSKAAGAEYYLVKSIDDVIEIGL
ncbi:MAG: VRR-NUC domain-containing protein [Gallionella sp.]